jgi:hypothetical protein
MIRGSKNLLEWFKLVGNPHWKIITEKENGKGGNFIVSSPNSPVLSIDESYERLKQALEFLHNGRYVVITKPELDTTKTLAQTVFDHDSNTADQMAMVAGTNPMYQQPVVNGISKEEMADEIRKAIDQERKENELQRANEKIKELEFKNRELERESMSAINGITKRLEPFVEPVMKTLFPQTQAPARTAVAAVGFANTSDEANLDASKKLKATLEKWQDLDPDHFIAVIEKIVDTAENNKGTYEMYRGMLIGK